MSNGSGEREWKSIASNIWECTVCQKPNFKAPKFDKTRIRIVNSLSALLPDEDWEEIYSDCSANANRELRKQLSRYLVLQSDEGPKLAYWIVHDWGGIRLKRDNREDEVKKLTDWSEELGDFSTESIRAFVEKMGRKRISSWSKILSFAQPETQAIYDSRTAAALNCILFDLGCRVGFFMPVSENSKIKLGIEALRNLKFEYKYGYASYIRLLKAIVEASEASDILEVETALFANAPGIVSDFSARHPLPEFP